MNLRAVDTAHTGTLLKHLCLSGPGNRMLAYRSIALGTTCTSLRNSGPPTNRRTLQTNNGNNKHVVSQRNKYLRIGELRCF